ncbi:MAG TPA: FecR domain-containing protein [Methylomirabilota bacterium]|nr:FecR domain-containing protein [Methylomirabilota bacterium]
MFRPKIFVMAAALLCASPVLAAAEPEESAGVVTTVNGDATLLRAVASAQPVSLQMRDEIFVRDRIQTRERSLVRVLLGGKALITVRELSILTVTEEAGRVTVDLQSGKVGVAVVKARMRPGEVIEIRTPNATAAVRGTVFVVEVDPMQPGQPGGAPATTTRVHLFHGALDVSARLDPNNATVRLAELQSVVVAGNVLGSVKPISRDAVATLTADLKPRQVQVPDAPSEFTGGLVAREQGRAVMLAAALLAPTPAAPVQGTLKNVKGTVNGLNQVVTNGNTAETLERLMDSLGLETVGGALGNTVDALGTNVVGGALNGVGGVVSGLGGTVASLGNTVGGLGGTVGGLGGTVGGLGGTVGGLGGTVGGLGGTVGGLGGTVGGLGGTVGGLGGTVGGLGGAVGGTVGGLGGAIGGLGGTVGGTVGGLGGGTVGGVVGGLGGGVGHLLGH